MKVSRVFGRKKKSIFGLGYLCESMRCCIELPTNFEIFYFCMFDWQLIFRILISSQNDFEISIGCVGRERRREREELLNIKYLCEIGRESRMKL
jgi:hypothetical protein